MGKKKASGYNDFLDGEKLRDNAEIWTSPQGPSSASTKQNISPPPACSDQKDGKKNGKYHNASKKPPLTHFLCLPLITESSRPKLQSALEELKTHLITTNLVPTKGIRPVGTLHLTLGVMSLSDTQLEAAKQHLQDLNLHILLRDIAMQNLAEQAALDGSIAENLTACATPDSDSLTIALRALTPMHAASKTSILYASPEDTTGRLYPFAKKLKEEFTKAGFMVDDQRALKLHATIINTIYAKPKGGARGGRRGGSAKEGVGREKSLDSKDEDEKSGDDGKSSSRNEGHGPDGRSWMRFDARDLVEKYKDFTWAESVRVDRVQICKMGAKKIWSRVAEGEGEVIDEKYEVVFEKGIDE